VVDAVAPSRGCRDEPIDEAVLRRDTFADQAPSPLPVTPPSRCGHGRSFRPLRWDTRRLGNRAHAEIPTARRRVLRLRQHNQHVSLPTAVRKELHCVRIHSPAPPAGGEVEAGIHVDVTDLDPVAQRIPHHLQITRGWVRLTELPQTVKVVVVAGVSSLLRECQYRTLLVDARGTTASGRGDCPRSVCL